jgi:hypothetical protein
MCFATAITGRGFSRRTIRNKFAVFIDKEDYDEGELEVILEHLYKLTKIDRNNLEVWVDEKTPRIQPLTNLISTESEKNTTLVKSPVEHIQTLRIENYFVPDIVLVGYGRTQTYQVKCLKCGNQFFPGDIRYDGFRNLFCEDCRDSSNLNKYTKARNKSDFQYLGNIVGWEVRSTSISRRNHRNYNKVLKRDNYTCQYCGYSPHKHTEYRPLHIDHIKPRSFNGSNSMNNMVVSCAKCNLYASNKWFDTFIEKKTYVLDVMKKKGQKIYV